MARNCSFGGCKVPNRFGFRWVPPGIWPKYNIEGQGFNPLKGDRDRDFFSNEKIPNKKIPKAMGGLYNIYQLCTQMNGWFLMVNLKVSMYMIFIYTGPVDPMDTACFKSTVVEHTFVRNMKSMCTVCIWSFLSHSFEIHPAPCKIQ